MDGSIAVKPNAIRVIAANLSKKRLFGDIAELAETAYGIDSAEAADLLQERENLDTTAVGRGVAVPHARIAGLESAAAVVMVLERPMEFGAPDRRPVDIVFALFTPAASGADHLKALARVSRALRDQAFCAKLRSNPDPSKLYAILADAPSVKAA